MSSLSRRAFLGTGAVLAAGGSWTKARAAATIRVGVLEDMNGPYSEIGGNGSVGGAKLAVEDFRHQNPDITVEVLVADMQTKADLAMSLTRDLFDTKDVDMVLGYPSSAAALAVAGLAREKNKVALITDAGTADLSGKACGPNHIHWTWDTYEAVTTPVKEFLSAGHKRFFFIAPDYALGASMVRDATGVIEAAGGTVVGTIKHPFPGVTDFSSYLLQAQASHPDVLIVASAGEDSQNTVRQAAEFGLMGRGIHISAPLLEIPDIHAIGLTTCHGLISATSYYWDRNDRSRAFATRMKPYVQGVPVQNHAGAYSATLNYLRAVVGVGIDTAKADGRAVIAHLKKTPTDDPLFGKGRVREDGRAIHDILLLRAKDQAESHSPWDLMDVVKVLSGDEAFRPLKDGGCPLAAQ